MIHLVEMTYLRLDDYEMRTEHPMVGNVLEAGWGAENSRMTVQLLWLLCSIPPVTEQLWYSRHSGHGQRQSPHIPIPMKWVPVQEIGAFAVKFTKSQTSMTA